MIYRFRTPGGIINSDQVRAIANFAEQWGNGEIEITNRANPQIRAVKHQLTSEVLQQLQVLKLAAPIPEVDHLRNLMASPTAGIDSRQLVDTRQLVCELDDYISTHPHLAQLPPKFSIGIDGGETASIIAHHNEILFQSVAEDGHPYFRLFFKLGKQQPTINTGVWLSVTQVVPMAIALMAAYLSYIKPEETLRLRDILPKWGLEDYLERTAQYLPFSLPNRRLHEIVSQPHIHPPLGVYPQLQPELFYMGCYVRLGRIKAWQMKELANLVCEYGKGTLRLTPWQNLIIPDIPEDKIPSLQQAITDLGLSKSMNEFSSTIVACTGNQGCASSATDTKKDALDLINYLEKHPDLKMPFNIHFTGCPKSCAQSTMADLTLLGTNEGYHLYLRKEGEEPFGQLLSTHVDAALIPSLVSELSKNLG